MLDDCPIIIAVRNYGPVDKERYPVQPTDQWEEEHEWQYLQRWSSFLSRIEEKLPKLKVFKLGNFHARGTSFDSGDWDVGMHENRYLVFDRCWGPTPWIERGHRDF